MSASTPGNSLLLASLLISQLLTFYVGTSVAADNHVRKSFRERENALYDTIKSKAAEKSIPATVSGAAARYLLYGDDKRLSELEWTTLGMVVVGHFALDNLEAIREVGEKNQAVLIASMRPMFAGTRLDTAENEDVKIEIKLMGASFYAVADSLSTVCGVSVSSEQEFRRARFTANSGGSIPVSEGCLFSGWILAAGGIAIESKDGEEHSVVIVDSVLQGEN